MSSPTAPSSRTPRARAGARPNPPAPVDDILQFSPTPLQDRFIRDVFSGKWRFFGLGGAIRGGKTISVIECLFLLCKFYPGSRWAIVRKDLPRIRRNTIPTIEKFAPRPFVGSLDKAEWKYRCANGSEILLIGEQLATDPDLDRFKGLEANGFVLEEANEVSEQTANKCKERLGSWIIRPTESNPEPRQPPALFFATFNPADNWVREWFYDPWREGRLNSPYYFLPALPTDNPYNTAEQWAAWRELPPEQYRRFIDGDWQAIIDPYQLLTFAQVMEAANVEPLRGRKREGLDVASGGDDDTVFCLIDGNVIDGAMLEVHHHWDEPTTAERARQRMQEHGIAPRDYVVDSVGIGSGVYNMLRRWGRDVRGFVAGGKPVPRLVQPDGGPTVTRSGYPADEPAPIRSMFSFVNLRSQAWWEFADGVKRGKWCILNPTKEMIRDLTAPRYQYLSELKIKVDSTDDIKELTGHSPDVGTAVVQAAFEWPRLESRQSTGTFSVWTG